MAEYYYYESAFILFKNRQVNNFLPDYSLNCTPLSPVTITYNILNETLQWFPITVSSFCQMKQAWNLKTDHVIKKTSKL